MSCHERFDCSLELNSTRATWQFTSKYTMLVALSYKNYRIMAMSEKRIGDLQGPVQLLWEVGRCAIHVATECLEASGTLSTYRKQRKGLSNH